ncbi:MAG: segregation and condensation protein A [Geminicoccaceae bacterium]
MAEPVTEVERTTADETLVVSLDGFEGPIDLLLTLARNQKVDLAKISILALVDQYMAFMAKALETRLEIAADYLLTASWLAYLKSRYLLPAAEDEAGAADEMVEDLTARLRRLDALKGAAAALTERPRLGQGRLVRGNPDGLSIRRVASLDLSLAELLRAYASTSQRAHAQTLTIDRGQILSIEEARTWLENILRVDASWIDLADAACRLASKPWQRRTRLASGFAASLELARQGRIQLNQEEGSLTPSLRRVHG